MYGFNFANVVNYAELANLMAPRPFMVERGHDDGAGMDEWVSLEYAKVRFCDQMGIGGNTTIEYFNGQHTIHGARTFDFLPRHLRHPEMASHSRTSTQRVRSKDYRDPAEATRFCREKSDSAVPVMSLAPRLNVRY